MYMVDRGYWERRAEQELTAAQEATDERVVRAHYELLGFYLDRLYPSPGAEYAGHTDGTGKADPAFPGR